MQSTQIIQLSTETANYILAIICNVIMQSEKQTCTSGNITCLRLNN